MVGPGGLEPLTSSVSRKRSNQLSYGPKKGYLSTAAEFGLLRSHGTLEGVDAKTEGRMRLARNGFVPIIAPGGRVIVDVRTRDVPQGVVNERAGARVERSIIRVFDQRGNSGHALLLCEHAGLSQTASRAFAHLSRRISVQDLEHR